MHALLLKKTLKQTKTGSALNLPTTESSAKRVYGLWKVFGDCKPESDWKQRMSSFATHGSGRLILTPENSASTARLDRNASLRSLSSGSSIASSMRVSLRKTQTAPWEPSGVWAWRGLWCRRQGHQWSRRPHSAITNGVLQAEPPAG